jgi:protein O-GlcNAc transferase
VKLDGQLAEAYTNLGIALQDLGESSDAEKMTGIAVKLKPDMAAGHNNHGRALENNNKLEKALSSYKKALSFSGQQGYADAFCAKVYLEHFLCGWDTLDTDMKEVAVHLENNLLPQFAAAEPCVQPFRAFAYPLPPTLFVNVTIKVVEQERVRVPTGNKAGVLKLSSAARHLVPPVGTHGPARIRVAYMSSDFGGHTVGSLIRNLLKLHNRNRAEVCGVGMMKGDGTEWNVEMQASTDKWLSIHDMSDSAAAFAIDALQVHILIDLNGHSKGARLGVLLRRPAPLIIRSAFHALASYAWSCHTSPLSLSLCLSLSLSLSVPLSVCLSLSLSPVWDGRGMLYGGHLRCGQ